MDKTVIKEACLLGAVAGMRSMMPLAALSLTARKRRWLRGASVLSVGELVYDKLPQAKSRTEPAGLIPRMVSGSVAGGLAAWLLRGPIAVGAGVGTLAALASTFLTHRLRAEATRRVPPAVAAVAEDLLAVGVSAGALKALDARIQ
jgi:uncharacterized membrane protein